MILKHNLSLSVSIIYVMYCCETVISPTFTFTGTCSRLYLGYTAELVLYSVHMAYSALYVLSHISIHLPWSQLARVDKAMLGAPEQTFIVNGYPCTYYGSLGLVLADNPASCAMGGFSSAYRHCHHCLGTKTEMKIEV